MPVNFNHKTLQEYSEQIARKEPVPGGGSAAAYTAALGAGLLCMVANYSIGRKSNTKSVETRLSKILTRAEMIRQRLLELTSLDSEAYLQIVAARQQEAKVQKKASRHAAGIGKEVCRLCYQATDLAPYLVEKGNPYLVSDVEVAVELLQAGFIGSMVMVKVNQ